MTTKPLDFSKKILALVTGTGRGIGKTLTEHLGSKMAAGSKLIAISNLPDRITQIKDLSSRVNTDVKIDVHIMDLSHVELGEYESVIDKSLVHPSIRNRYYEYGLIVHNAGSLGEVQKTITLQNVNTWRKYYNLNFLSPALLNSVFLRKCQPYMNHVYVVNITSIYSIRPQVNLSMYCSGKAARNAYFSVLAVEEPDVSVMNYSPGAVHTTLLDELEEKRPSRKGAKTVCPEVTIAKLLDTLSTGNYVSGSLVDIFGRNK